MHDEEAINNNCFVLRARSSIQGYNVNIAKKDPTQGIIQANCLIMTAKRERERMVMAIKAGLSLDKPFSDDDLIEFTALNNVTEKLLKDMGLFENKEFVLTMDNGGEIVFAAMDAYAQAMLECVILYANATNSWEESAKYLLKVQEYAFDNKTKNKIEETIQRFNETAKTYSPFDVCIKNKPTTTQGTGCLLPILSIILLCALLLTWI